MQCIEDFKVLTLMILICLSQTAGVDDEFHSLHSCCHLVNMFISNSQKEQLTVVHICLGHEHSSHCCGGSEYGEDSEEMEYGQCWEECVAPET